MWHAGPRWCLRALICGSGPLGSLLAPLRVLPVPLSFPCSLPRVVPSAARALPTSAAAGLGTVPAPSPSLLAVCAPACSLRVSLGTPPVVSCSPLRAPVAGTLPRLCAVSPLPDHAPGVLLPPQLRQRDARRRTLGRRGADVPHPPRGEGALRGERLGGAGVGGAGVGVGTVLRALPATRCGCGGTWRGARAAMERMGWNGTRSASLGTAKGTDTGTGRVRAPAVQARAQVTGRDRGWVVMVAVLGAEVEELWCRAPPAIILATAALPYVPDRGVGTSGSQARRATGTRLRGRGIPLNVRWAAISLSGASSTRPPLPWKKSPHSLPWALRTIRMAHSASPTSRPKVNGRRVVRVMTVVRQLSRFMGLMGPQLSGRLPTGGRLPRGASF